LLLEAPSGNLDPEQKRELERHLAECTNCRSQYEMIKKAFQTMDIREKYDPGEDYWNSYWDRLQARMGTEEILGTTPVRTPSRKVWSFTGLPRWVPLTVAAAALVMIGISIGRTISRPEFQSVKPGLGESAAILQAAASSGLSGRTALYLERSKRILLAVVNFAADPKDIYGLNLPAQRTASKELVREASGLKAELRGSKKRQLERLVGDLERILLQISNLQGGDDLAALGIIKAGAESGDILFKIDLAELNAARQANGPQPASPRSKTF
jgi:Putative zinc-finger